MTQVVAVGVIFQFQYGLIKSSSFDFATCIAATFQFQYGLIKRGNTRFSSFDFATISIPIWFD